MGHVTRGKHHARQRIMILAHTLRFFCEMDGISSLIIDERDDATGAIWPMVLDTSNIWHQHQSAYTPQKSACIYSFYVSPD